MKDNLACRQTGSKKLSCLGRIKV